MQFYMPAKTPVVLGGTGSHSEQASHNWNVRCDCPATLQFDVHNMAKRLQVDQCHSSRGNPRSLSRAHLDRTGSMIRTCDLPGCRHERVTTRTSLGGGVPGH